MSTKGWVFSDQYKNQNMSFTEKKNTKIQKKKIHNKKQIATPHNLVRVTQESRWLGNVKFTQSVYLKWVTKTSLFLDLLDKNKVVKS